MPLSCDDEFIPNTFTKKIAFFNDINLALVFESKIIFIDENNRQLDGLPMEIDEFENPEIETILEFNYLFLHSFYIQGAVFRKDIIDEVGGFDEDMICDDIILRTKYLKHLLKSTKYKVIMLHELGVLYRQHDNNIYKDALRQVNGVIEYLMRYWPDRNPPEILYQWLDHAMKQTNISDENKLLIFLNDSYMNKILQHKNYLNLIANGEIFNDELEFQLL